MCLDISKTPQQNTAEEDIFCYKILELYNHNLFNKKIDTKYSLLTFYKNFMINIGKTYESLIIKNSDGNIEQGLHSYAELSNIIDYLIDYRFNETNVIEDINLVNGDMIDKNSKFFKYVHDYIVIAECIIPKGSTYYVGDFMGSKSYASDCLKYIKII